MERKTLTMERAAAVLREYPDADLSAFRILDEEGMECDPGRDPKGRCATIDKHQQAAERFFAVEWDGRADVTRALADLLRRTEQEALRRAANVVQEQKLALGTRICALEVSDDVAMGTIGGLRREYDRLRAAEDAIRALVSEASR